MAVIQLPCFTAACDECKTESGRRNVHYKTAEEATEQALADAWTVLPDGRTYCMWCTGDLVRSGRLVEAGDGTGIYRAAEPAPADNRPAA